MATLITKNSSTASAVPAAGDLVKGELAVNVTDKKVYTKDNSAAVVKLVGSLGNQEANAVAITGGAINGTTIGATTPSTGAFTTASASGGFTGNLTGNVTGNVSGTAANVTGVVAIANGGTGLSSLGTGVQSALGQAVTGSGSFVLSTSPSLTTPNLGTPSAAVLTNATGLPLTTGVTGTLGVANGGTGQTTANAAFNALAPSQSTHAGKYLKTDGTNTSWDAIEINTADITGTLPVANGGTGTSTALTSGSVVFAGASGVYSQNNTNFFWDNTTSSLGIGTPTPVGKLHLNVSSGAIYYRISSGVNAMLMGGLAGASGEVSSNGDLVFGAGTSFAERGRYSSDGTFRVKGAGTAGSTDAFQVSGSAPANSFILNSSGNITLASPGTFTYSSGTANGVAYLNASKALTTGSALTYNGSVLGVADGSITAGNTAVVLTGKYSSGFPTTGAGYFQLQTNNVDGTTGGLTVLTNSAGTLRQSYRIHEDTTAAACYQSWNVGGSEQARLTTTGLGIGTSSPRSALDVAGTGAASWSFGANSLKGVVTIGAQGTTTSSLVVNTAGLSAGFPAGFAVDGTYSNPGGIGTAVIRLQALGVASGGGYDSAMTFWTSSGATATEKARIDSAGNLGIGTTSPDTKLDVRGNAVIGARSGYAELALNSLSSSASARSASFRKNWDSPFDFNIYASNGTSGSSAATIFYRDSVNESMRITSSGNVGIGTSSPGYRLTVAGTSGSAVVNLLETGVRSWGIRAGGTATNTFDIADFTAGATRLTIDSSGNLGIGTSSPITRFNVVDSVTNTFSAAFRGAGGSNIVGLGTTSGGAAIAGYTAGFAAAADLIVNPFGGNLGLGVTPSSWGSGQKAFETQAGSLAALSTSLFDLVQNTYNSGTGYIYKTTAAATVYRQTAGQHLWFNAASGTAGNAISFTQAMTLDASGNLLVGRTSRIITETFSSTGYGLFGGATVQGIIGDAGSGLVTVGAYSNHALEFRTNNTERARITSGGYFKASNSGAYTNSTGSYFEFYQTAAVDCLLATRTTDTAGVAVYYSNLGGGVTHTNSNHFYGVNNGTIVYRIAANGNVTNTNNSYGAISDIKLKENITDATPKLSSLNQLRVVNYNFKGSDLKQIGLVAQEVEQVFPGLVETSADRDAEGNDLGTTTKSVKYSVLVPMLLKAVQELTAMNDDLRARVAQLEAK